MVIFGLFLNEGVTLASYIPQALTLTLTGPTGEVLGEPHQLNTVHTSTTNSDTVG